MTRKHFEAIATIVNKHHAAVQSEKLGDWDRGYGHACENIARSLAAEFESFDPNFDRARFLKACGIEE